MIHHLQDRLVKSAQDILGNVVLVLKANVESRAQSRCARARSGTPFIGIEDADETDCSAPSISDVDHLEPVNHRDNFASRKVEFYGHEAVEAGEKTSKQAVVQVSRD